MESRENESISLSFWYEITISSLQKHIKVTNISDFQWKIGMKTKTGYTGTTTVFGWDLSGENFVWPDTANLFIIGDT